jgi:biuret amidohydrolase
VPLADGLVDAGHTAVLTMELQRGVVGDLARIRALADEVASRRTLEAVARLLGAARAAGAHVVHCTVGYREDRAGTPANAPILRGATGLAVGSAAAELMPSLGAVPSDLVEPRNHGMSPFGGTGLDATLRALGVRTVVATGVSVNIGVFGMVLEAVNLGYEAVVPTDAVAGIPASYADAVLANSLRYLATLTTVDELAAAWSG